MSETKTDEYGERGRVVIDPAKLQGKVFSEELDKIGVLELSNCNIICDPLTAAATKTAYSIEEHMFNQDEIQRRNKMTDQQRSEAVTTSINSTGRTCVVTPYDCWDDAVKLLTGAKAAIAERDATIAELRAANERLVAGQSTWYRTAEAQDKQIAAMQAKLQHVHDAAERSMPTLHGCTLDRDWLMKFTTPTTEK